MALLDPLVVAPGEPIDRFVFDRDVRKSDGSIRGRAFYPPGSLRLSVYRTHDCPDGELWKIYATHVKPARPASIGTARFAAGEVFSIGLRFDPDGVPHHRHANIIGWPVDDHEWRMRADNLASVSQFFQRP